MSRQRTFPLNEQAKVLLCCSIPNAALRLFECWTVIGCVSFAFALLVGYKVVSNMTPEEGCRQAWQDMPSLMPSCSGSGIRLVPSCMCAGHKSGDKVQRDIETGSEGDEEIVKTDFTPPNVPPLPIAAAREIEVEEERSESDPQASSQQSIPLPAPVNLPERTEASEPPSSQQSTPYGTPRSRVTGSGFGSQRSSRRSSRHSSPKPSPRINSPRIIEFGDAVKGALYKAFRASSRS